MLRDEIEKTGWQAFDKSGGKTFPLMDSFMKESARLTPVESGKSTLLVRVDQSTD